MIPIKPQPEPTHFNKKVRLKGQKYLSKMGSSTIDAAAWKSHSYWRDILPDLHEAYSSICAYCAPWISPGTGDSTVEHSYQNQPTVTLLMSGVIIDSFVVL